MRTNQRYQERQNEITNYRNSDRNKETEKQSGAFCIYIYSYTCICIYVHTYMHRCMPAYIPTCIHVCVCIHAYTACISVYMHPARAESKLATWIDAETVCCSAWPYTCSGIRISGHFVAVPETLSPSCKSCKWCTYGLRSTRSTSATGSVERSRTRSAWPMTRAALRGSRLSGLGLKEQRKRIK